MNKLRCCNCGHVFSSHKSCVKCGSDAVEALVAAPRQSTEDAKNTPGPKLLTEVPDRKANLLG